MASEELTFDDWLKAGIQHNFIGAPVCYTHDGLPTSEDEDEEFSEGDPCIHILRLYESPEKKTAIEDNHSPSVWRNPFRKPE
jgi:hypothetical protein